MLSLILPIVLSLWIGVCCHRKKLLKSGTIGELKSLVTTFFLPMLSFRMFSSVELGETTFLLVLLSFGLLTLALLLGFATKRCLGQYGTYGRFLMSSAEGGMIGVGLFQMLYGTESLHYLAPIELGQGLFYFIVYLTVLTEKRDAGYGLKPMEKVTGVIKRILTMPVFDGCLAGMLYQIFGISTLMKRLGLSENLYACIDVFTALIMPLILITIGYELTFDRDIWLPIFKTVMMRICILGFCLALGLGILRAIGITEQAYYIALAFEYSLPPAFLITAYVEESQHRRYLNAALSFYVIVTLAFAMGFRAFFTIS